MAPLPPNSTARLFVDYETCGVNHTSMIRFSSPNTYDDAQVEWNDVVEASDAALYLLTILGARVAVAGSNITFPVTWIQQATYGADVGPRYAGANMLNYIGRSFGGKRAAFEMFGCKVIEVTNLYRIQAADNADIAAGLVELRAGEGTALAIDGTQPIWQDYANVGPSAYWRNKLR